MKSLMLFTLIIIYIFNGNLARKLGAVYAYVSFLIPINHFYAKGSSTNQFARTTSHDIFSLCPVVKV